MSSSEGMKTMTWSIRPTGPNGRSGDVEALRKKILAEFREEARSAHGSFREPFELMESAFLPESRSHSGDLSSEFHLGVVLERAVESTRMASLGQGNRISVNKEPSVPAVLHGDGWRLQRAVVLLLGHLARMVQEATIGLSVSLSECMPDRAVVRFDVWTNRDLPEPSTDHRMEPPHLAVARALVNSMTGDFSGPHRYGLRTVYRFYLPFCVPSSGSPSGDGDPSPHADGSWTRSGSYAHSRRVLLAEDNKVTQAATRMLLERRGHEVITVSDGRAAVEMVRTRVFDVVLMDLDMPEQNGVEATRAIRTFPSAGPPIVAYTAHSRLEDRRLCMEAGVDGFLAKPVSSVDLFRAVERWPRRSDA
jgi:CheY-like chemotaxis protein